ncbi:MAG: selenium metabolism-associated LysR family transcriptional regulator [Lachnospiraceae bacterium]|nr:selenium metabolism-associated LysR family transcriptional regulator [Lachnospiraceae bacterium]
MEFKHLQAFATVVKYNSFTKAADKLYLTQPTISSQIRQLEEELGTTLLHRTTKSIQVTEKGMALYRYAESILTQRDRIFQRCSGLDHCIHVAASTVPAACLLPRVLPAFSDAHPDVTYEISKGDSSTVVEAIRNGLFDLGIIGTSCKDKDLTVLPICPDHPLLIMPNEEPYLSCMADEDLSWLKRTPFILREKGSGSAADAADLLQHVGIKEQDLKILARIDDPELIKSLVMNGMGVAIMSSLTIKKEVEDNRLLTLDLMPSKESRWFNIIYPKKQILPDYIKDFINALIAGGA